MAKRVQRYRATASAMQQITGPVGELIVNLTRNSLHVHDGVTPGGHELGRADASNIVVVSASNNGIMTSAMLAELTAATADIASLDTRLTAAEGDIDNLETAMAAAEADIDALQTAVTALQSANPGNLKAPEGTAMLFVQTAAPTGWTKQATHDNKALRVVTGTAGTGGSVAFTTAFASKTPAGTLNTVADHTHAAGSIGITLTRGRFDDASGDNRPWVTTVGSGAPGTTAFITATGTSGAGGSHSHTFTGTAINLAVQYVDVIYATKDAA